MFKGWWGHLDPMSKGCYDALKSQLKAHFNPNSLFNPIMINLWPKIKVIFLEGTILDLEEDEGEVETPMEEEEAPM